MLLFFFFTLLPICFIMFQMKIFHVKWSKMVVWPEVPQTLQQWQLRSDVKCKCWRPHLPSSIYSDSWANIACFPIFYWPPCQYRPRCPPPPNLFNYPGFLQWRRILQNPKVRSDLELTPNSKNLLQLLLKNSSRKTQYRYTALAGWPPRISLQQHFNKIQMFTGAIVS